MDVSHRAGNVSRTMLCFLQQGSVGIRAMKALLCVQQNGDAACAVAADYLQMHMTSAQACMPAVSRAHIRQQELSVK